MLKKLSKILKKVLILLILLLVIIIGIIHSINYEIVINAALDFVNEAIPGEIKLKKINFNLFSGVLDIGLLSLKDQKGKEVVFLKNFKSEFSILKIIDQKYHLPKVTIQKLRGSLNNENIVKSLGLSSKEKEEAPDSSPTLLSDIDLKINDFSLDSIEFKYFDEANLYAVKKAKIRGNINFPQKSDLKINLDQALIKSDSLAIPIAQILIETSLTKNKLLISKFLCRLKKTKIELAGKLGNIYEPNLDIKADLESDLQDVREIFKIANTSGKVKLKANLKGELDSLSGEAKIKIQDFEYQKIALGMNLELLLKENKLFLDKSFIETSQGRIDLLADFDLKKMVLNSQIVLDSLSTEVFAGFDLPYLIVSGDLNLKSEDIRELKKADLKANLKIDTLNFQNIEERNLLLNIDLKKNENYLKLEQLELVSKLLNSQNSGEISLASGNGKLKSFLNCNLNSLEMLLPEQKIEGKFNFKTDLSLKNLVPFGDFYLSIDSCEYSEFTLDKIWAEGAIADQNLVLDSLKIAINPQDQIFLKGQVSPKESDLKISSSKINLAILEPFLADSLKGTAVLDGEVLGNLNNPKINLKTKLSDLSYGIYKLDQAIINSGLNNKNLVTDILINNNDLNLHSEFFAPDKIKLRANLNNLNVTDLMPNLAKQKLSSKINGQIDAFLNLNDLYNGSCEIKMADFELAYDSLNLLKASKFHLLASENKLDGKIKLISKNSRLGFNFYSNNLTKQDFKADFSANLNIEDFDKFLQIPIDKYSGNINLETKVSYKDQQFTYSGGINWDNLSLANQSPPFIISKSTSDIYFDSKKVAVKDFKIEANGGFLDLKGELTHHNFSDLEVSGKIDISNFPIYDPNSFKLRINSDLNIITDQKSAKIKGTIDLIDGIYFKDVNFNLLSLLTDESRAISLSDEYDDLEGNDGFFLDYDSDLDLVLQSKNPLLMSNNLGEIELTPDLTIKGSINKPYLGGNVRINKGFIYLGENELNINKGEVEFNDPYRINPKLDIESEVEIDEYLVKVAIGGDLDKLSLVLSSDPNLEQADILKLLITGSLLDDTSLQYKAYNYLYKNIAKKIEKKSGIDEVVIEQSSADNFSISLRDQITKNLSLEYNFDSDKEGETHQTKFDYRLYRSFYLSGYQNNKGNFGGRLKFKFKFR